MELPEEAKRAPSAPVWNQSFPSPTVIFRVKFRVRIRVLSNCDHCVLKFNECGQTLLFIVIANCAIVRGTKNTSYQVLTRCGRT